MAVKAAQGANMNWTRPGDLRGQVQKLWDRGELLSCLVTGEPLFPKRLILKAPSSSELTERFEEARAWISEIRSMPYCRVEMREFRHRVLGANAVPDKAWIGTASDAAALIGKQRDLSRFMTLVEMTRKTDPRLLGWLAKRPLRALDLFDDWDRLLEIVCWRICQAKPGIYLRQVDIPGVHSKFIEAHRGVLGELLDIVLPPDEIDASVSGISQFAQRYGFRDKPVRIRFRVLDPVISPLPGESLQDITLDAQNFAQLSIPVSRVFITENEINFLAFPEVKESLVIFGAGYGFEMLNEARWLANCSIHYWGDIDTHGFAILDQLRNQFNHVESLMMDRNTLLAFELQWGSEEKQTLRDLHRLTDAEQNLYDDLRDNKIRKNLRLEQERIGFRWVEAVLARLS
jgi:hypothetical protein